MLHETPRRPTRPRHAIVRPLESRTLLAIRPLDTVIDPTAGNAVPLSVQDVAQSAGHGSVVVGTSGNTVQVRRFGSDGKPLSSSIRADASGTDSIPSVRVAINASGRSVVVWESISAAPQSEEGVHARIFAADGTPATGVIDVFPATFEAALADLDVGIATDGRFFVSYTTQNGTADAQTSIVGYTSAGRRFTNASIGPATAYSFFPRAALAVAPGGGFAVVHTVTNHDSAGYSSVAEAETFTSAGGSLVTGLLMDSSTTSTAPTGAAITARGDLGYVVAWNENYANAGPTITVRYLERTGGNGPIRPVASTGVPADATPIIGADAIGNFTIGWNADVGGVSREQLRSYDVGLSPTSDAVTVGIGGGSRMLHGLVYFGRGTFADLATVTPSGGAAREAFSAYSNVLAIDGSTQADDIDLTSARFADKQWFVLLRYGQGQSIRADAYVSVEVDLRGGDDVFKDSMPLPTVLHGGEGNDRVTLSSRDDTIYGDAGNDTINAGGGRDYVSAGDGNDVVQAGAGDDNVVGGAGKNRLEGEDGDDRLSGSNGHDVLIGGAGDDRLYGNGGGDSLDGGGGSDRLYGGDGDDLLLGGAGKDRLYGEAGNDTLSGGAMADQLFGGDGTDTRLKAEASDMLDSIEING